MKDRQDKSQEEIVKEAVKEAKEAAEAAAGKASCEDAEKERQADCQDPDGASEKKGQDAADPRQTSDKEEKKEKKDKKDEKIEELTDRVTRQMAEFDNFRKRTEKEKAQMYEIGARDIVEKILPVVDNFERGLSAVKEEEKDQPFVQGMEMIYKQMMTTLSEAGVEVIAAVGEAFDPNLHNAVMHVEDEEQGENIVVEEFQKGYKYRETVIRHSMVKVAN